jgi:hypothetical protein
MGTLSDLVDAVAADLAGLTLPTHSVWKYVDPPVLRPDLGAMLGIFPRETDPTMLATNSSYQQDDRIVVAWYQPVIPSPETGGIGDPAVAATALATAETIFARLRTYGTAVPGLADESEATVEKIRYGIIQGSVVWTAEITLKVTRWPA